jgi:hypothetical protein
MMESVTENIPPGTKYGVGIFKVIIPTGIFPYDFSNSNVSASGKGEMVRPAIKRD